MPAVKLAESLAEAFNRRSLNEMASLLAETATAEVLDSGFPVEEGRAAISKISFPYLLNNGDANEPLKAQARMIEDTPFVLLCREKTGEADVVMKFQEEEGKIIRIDYLVTGFRRDEMVQLLEPLGIKVILAEK